MWRICLVWIFAILKTSAKCSPENLSDQRNHFIRASIGPGFYNVRPIFIGIDVFYHHCIFTLPSENFLFVYSGSSKLSVNNNFFFFEGAPSYLPSTVNATLVVIFIVKYWLFISFSQVYNNIQFTIQNLYDIYLVKNCYFQ